MKLALDVERVAIAKIVVGVRRRQKLGNLRSLAKSIGAHGLLHPILLRNGHELVAGQRRLEACKLLGWTTIPARRVDGLSDEDLRAVELEENTEDRALFKGLGGNVSMRALGREAKKRDYFDEEMLGALMERACSEYCRVALKKTGPDDLPARWKQIDLMSYKELSAVILADADAVLADHKELRRLHQWCRLKFGKAPRIPALG